ncbi:hypothetical protein OOZ19_14120 [Saccharopolyspora sp. NFXS83]|uniref:hypothetical protein n=1 Tax=Saccharopolyspora sp. NFXS83 TaxID=2993560 RepID=UPI00224A5D52|nr:hypothetical protein [Saccharopolyspora sp. NFXS83]MCX2731379.1 hypothetical protein [Saccharopolyspora sp. NFXS83]
MAGAALLVLAVFAIVAVLLAPDRPDDDEPSVQIPAPRAEDQTNPVDLPNAANEKENA